MAAQKPGVEKHVKGALLVLRISSGHYFLLFFFFTVALDRLSEKGTTCSLVQKGFPPFSSNNALVLGGVIIN